MSVRGAQQRIIEAAGQWAGVEVKPHRFGALEFRLGRRELGHIHGDRLLDIPFPKKVRDEIVACGDAEPHHYLPNSGWVSVSLRSEKDVPRAIRLLERSFTLATLAATPSARRDGASMPRPLQPRARASISSNERFGRERAPAAVSSEESGAEIVAKFNGRKTSNESEE